MTDLPSPSVEGGEPTRRRRLTVGTDRERPMQDGSTVRKPHDTPFAEWAVLPADDVDGVRWFFHVPTVAAGALPVPEAQKSTADLALQRSKSRHAAWCFLPADHDGACDGDQ